MKLYAWAYGLSSLAIINSLEEFPGLGAVLYSSNYSVPLSMPQRPFIAFVNNVADAQKLSRFVAEGARFEAVIVLDERNAYPKGPSGEYMCPPYYKIVFDEIREHLPEGVPVSTMGLITKSNLWQRTIWRGRFDDWYHKRLPPADLRATNPNKIGRRELERMLDVGVSIFSPAIFRGWYYNFMQPIKAREWCDIARDPRVFAVCNWSLVQDGTQPHGLLSVDGDITSIGRVVRRELERANAG